MTFRRDVNGNNEPVGETSSVSIMMQTKTGYLVVLNCSSELFVMMSWFGLSLYTCRLLMLLCSIDRSIGCRESLSFCGEMFGNGWKCIYRDRQLVCFGCCKLRREGDGN